MDRAAHEKQFVVAFREAHLASRSGGFGALVERLRDVEAKFVAAAEGDRWVVIETRRRVAEGIFLSSLDRHASFASCEGFYTDICNLGFSSRARELTYKIIFARQCLRFGEAARAITLLEPLVQEWARTKEAGGRPEFPAYDMRLAEDTLQDLRAALGSNAAGGDTGPARN